jgi:hypothetical protein
MNKNMRNKMFTDERIPQILQDIITIEQKIVNLQGDIQGDITNIQNDITTIQGDIITIQGDITTIQNDITTIQGDITTINSTLSGLSSNYEIATGFLTATTPSEFGTIPFYLVRNYKAVTLTIYPKTKALTADVPEIIFGGAIPNTPTNFRPNQEMFYPQIFKSGGAYDTGLVGAVYINEAGTIKMIRDLDASPSDFTGESGWTYAISISYITS